MKKIVPLYLILIIILIGCQPTSEEIQKLISQTQTALPTIALSQTPTVIQIKNIDLTTIIDIPHSLPTGFTLSQIRSGYPGYVEKLHVLPVNMIRQDLEFQGKKSGYVSVFIYDSDEQASELYEGLHTQIIGDGASDIFPNIGEKSFGVNSIMANTCFIIFTRCSAFIDVGVDDSNSYNGLQDYAEALDRKLSESICR